MFFCFVCLFFFDKKRNYFHGGTYIQIGVEMGAGELLGLPDEMLEETGVEDGL